MPDDFTHQGESTGTQWVKLCQFCFDVVTIQTLLEKQCCIFISKKEEKT
jgi:hypothetical protein